MGFRVSDFGFRALLAFTLALPAFGAEIRGAGYVGDFAAGETVRIVFFTYDASGASVAASSAFEAADVEIYKDGSDVQRASDSGVTMSSGFDSVTGAHAVAIDLSDNSDSGFWAAGSDYVVTLQPDETVDSQNVDAVIGAFSIGNRFGDVNVLTIESLDATAQLDTAADTVTVTSIGSGVITATSIATDAIGAAEIAADAIGASELAADAIGASEVASAAIVAGTELTGLNDPTAAAVRAEIDSNSTQLAAIVADTGELQTDWANGGRLDVLVDAIKAVTDALTSSSAGKLAVSAGVMVEGTVDNTAHSPTTTVFQADDVTEATADHFNGRIIIFTSGALQYQATAIEDYALVGGRGQFTVTALTEAPANNATFIIL